MTTSIKRDPVQILSPLRYPGAKRRLSSYVTEVLRINDLRPKLFVEPFAGGASVALQLAECDLVEKIALAELDPLVAAFWKTVFDDAEWLLEALAELEISVENWDYFRQNNFRSNRDRALACIFLNRTSFSGILAPSAGPIGGRSQRSKYKIDCRFAYDAVSRRITQAAKLRDRVLFVDRATWSATIEKVHRLGYRSNDVFFYFDPPFYEAGPRLYTHYFTTEQHKELYKALSRLKEPWLLSYDPAEPIVKMYSGNGWIPKRVSLLYSVAATEELANAQELIVSNLPQLPAATRVWRTSTEWRSLRGRNGKPQRK